MSTTATDRATGLAPDVSLKAPVKAATTANITLSGEQTIDGVSVVSGDRVLVKNQTSSVNNGIYVCDTGSWERDVDFDGARDVVSGTLVNVNQGTIASGSLWRLTTADPITIGSSSLTFTRATIDGAGYLPSSGGTLSGALTMTGAAINEAQGADIVSAATINLTTATGNLVDVTGAVAITAITLAQGYSRTVRFTGALTLTHGASLVLPGAASITTAAGDIAIFRGYAAGVVRCVSYTKASGAAIASASSATTQALNDVSTLIATDAYVHKTIAAVRGLIGGYIISSMAGTSTTAAFTISAGGCADSTGVAVIGKTTSTSWAAANGNAINGTDAGASTLANSSTYHIYIIAGASGVGSFVSTSTTPTFPTGYTTYSRRIGSFSTNGSGTPLAYASREIGGGASLNYLTTQVLDINGATPATASRTLYTLSLPTGLILQPLYRANPNTSTAGAIIITSPDETDVAPSAYTSGNYYNFFAGAPGYDGAGNATGSSMKSDGVLVTNTSAQIGIRALATAPVVYWVTRGWIDFRRS